MMVNDGIYPMGTVAYHERTSRFHKFQKTHWPNFVVEMASHVENYFATKEKWAHKPTESSNMLILIVIFAKDLDI